jgi:hypothetical protein
VSQISELLQSVRHHAIQAGTTSEYGFEYGEVSVYDPAHNSAKFLLPNHPDTTTGKPIETGWIRVGVAQTGPGYGVQFTPPVGAQAQLMSLPGGAFVCLGFTNNDVETPPYQDGKSSGWQDAKGNQVRSTVDGTNPGDGLGGVKLFAKNYLQHLTQGGHSFVASDTLRNLAMSSAGGHIHILDDLNQRIKTVSAGGHFHLMDDANQIMKHVSAGGLQHLFDDTVGGGGAMSHVGQVAVGAVWSAMSSSNAILNNSHLTTFENSIFNQRLLDMIKITATYVSTGSLLNPTSATSAIASLVLSHISIPGGSILARVAS